ncbi:TPA: hypothetical protein JG909_000249 [Enterobacter hormaechei subsp. steigerwaltii]|nr:hypothetical protein [Enterobacter hormaechei subsp. steigerwaltii]HAV1795400.1 hypothetical protein [Enterobacter hormaechei subsp. steigerwaltii]
MSIKNLVEMIKHNGLLTSMAQLEKLYRVAIDNEQKLADSEAKCAALAAENAGLKKFITQECHVAHVEPETFYEEEITRYVNADGYEPETPATDAFLAEVQASAIEHAAADRWGSGYIFNELNELAAQIRKGVQS